MLIPDTGNKEKHCANMMIGLIDACKLSVFGSKALTEAATGSNTENLFCKFNSRFVGPALDHRILCYMSNPQNLLPIVSISGFRLSNLPNCELLLGDLKISLLALITSYSIDYTR